MLYWGKDEGPTTPRRLTTCLRPYACKCPYRRLPGNTLPTCFGLSATRSYLDKFTRTPLASAASAPAQQFRLRDFDAGSDAKRRVNEDLNDRWQQQRAQRSTSQRGSNYDESATLAEKMKCMQSAPPDAAYAPMVHPNVFHHLQGSRGPH